MAPRFRCFVLVLGSNGGGGSGLSRTQRYRSFGSLVAPFSSAASSSPASTPFQCFCFRQLRIMPSTSPFSHIRVLSLASPFCQLRTLCATLLAGEFPRTTPKLNNFDREIDGVLRHSDALEVNDRSEAPVEGEGTDSNKSWDFVTSCDPKELYREIKGNRDVKTREKCDWDRFNEVMEFFKKFWWQSDQAFTVHMPWSFYSNAVSKFRSFLRQHAMPNVLQCIVFHGTSKHAERFMSPLFVEFCDDEFPDEMKWFRQMTESADLTNPHTWFPFARAMKRRIIYHCGPTNSGKTYNALQRFMDAKKGVYCSPLRLLAMEVFDKVNSLGVYCSLLTGQERRIVPFSNHTACTIEMVPIDEVYDVAIIDEIQMAADPTRGHAWTRALLGLKADEIHLCGDPSALKIVRKICNDIGDVLEERHYQRFKSLVVESRTLMGDLKNVRAGDCIVAFSRREIFQVKFEIERLTDHRCCVIYGALPPETRRQQAQLFNDEDNEFDVLVASDAVGMGLNLNIRRVVFYTLSKYNGDDVVPVPTSQVKQIAGRAGRRGCRYPDGLVTTLQSSDMDYLIECLEEPFDEIKQVGLFPFFEQVEMFAGQYPDISFPRLLDKLREACRLDGSYFLCHLHHVRKVAEILEKVPDLSLQERFNFCFAPVNNRNPMAMFHLLEFASCYGEKRAVSIGFGLPKDSACNDSELLDLESKHQVLSMYLWLSQQLDKRKFPFKNKAEEMVTVVVNLLSKSLMKANWKPESRYQRNMEDKIHKQFDIKKSNHEWRPSVNCGNGISSIRRVFQK